MAIELRCELKARCADCRSSPGRGEQNRDGRGRLAWKDEPASQPKTGSDKGQEENQEPQKCHGTQRRKTLKEKVPETTKSQEG